MKPQKIAKKWMELEKMILSKVTQALKDKNAIYSLIEDIDY